jgi:organic anion transporter 5A
LATNPIFVLHVLGITFKLIGYLGYYILKPKYIESQFRKSASDANYWTGIIIIPTMGFGIISSGFILSRTKPNARSVSLYVFFVEISIAIAILYAKTFQCPIPVFPQTHEVNGK